MFMRGERPRWRIGVRLPSSLGWAVGKLLHSEAPWPLARVAQALCLVPRVYIATTSPSV